MRTLKETPINVPHTLIEAQLVMVTEFIYTGLSGLSFVGSTSTCPIASITDCPLMTFPKTTKG